MLIPFSKLPENLIGPSAIGLINRLRSLLYIQIIPVKLQTAI